MNRVSPKLLLTTYERIISRKVHVGVFLDELGWERLEYVRLK